MKIKPISVYIHVPFCLRKCGYCDFYSVVSLDKKKDYIDLVVQEIKDKTGPQKISPKTLFFGGGTPSILTIEDFEKIIQCFDMSRCIEWTIEANPDTVSLDLFTGLKKLGLTRVSIGMQSSSDCVLKRLDRTHNKQNVQTCVNLCKELNLDVSLDLIYGTPFETKEEWKQSVKDAIKLNPDHISCYALTLEPNVHMYKINKPLIDEDLQAEKYFIGDEMLENHGYSFYEISNWSKKGKECKHNLSYWKRENYFGFGPSAHSFEKIPFDNKNFQQVLDKNEELKKIINDLEFGTGRIVQTRYSNSSSIPWKENFREILTVDNIELEEKMMRLRLKNGVPRDKRMIIDSLI